MSNHRNGSGGKKKKKRVPGYVSKRSVTGPGIFMTAIRGKESRAIQEFYNVLEEVADRLYPSERLVEFEKLRSGSLVTLTREIVASTSTTATGEGIEVDGDKTRVESEPNDAEEEEEEEGMEVEAEEESEQEEEQPDQSIEAQIAREIAALNPTRKLKNDDNNKLDATTLVKKKKKDRARFISVETGTECVCFFSIQWPYDPVELSRAVVDELRSSKILKTKFCQRITPVSFSCHAIKTDQVLSRSKDLIHKKVKEYADLKQVTEITFSIDPSIRSHSEPITRSWILKEFGQLVQSIATLEGLKIKANLSKPDLVFLPIVLMKEFGFGIVEGEGWIGEGRKWNLDMLGADINKKIIIEQGERERKGDDDGIETNRAVVNRSLG